MTDTIFMNSFRIKKNEIILSVFLLVVSLALNILYLRKFYGVYCPIISGYDPYLLSTITNWFHSPYINSNSLYSHPGFGILLVPLSLINSIMSLITGSNCANFLLTIILIAMYIIEIILIKRLLNECIGLTLFESMLLSILYSGMAFVLLMSFTPDHFAFSHFFLILYIYVWANYKLRKCHIKILNIITLVISSITITNGVKVLASRLLLDRKHFYKCFFIIIVSIPLLLFVSKVFTKNVEYSTNSGEMAYLEQEYKASVNYNHFYTDKQSIETKCLMTDSTKCEKYRQEAYEELNSHYSSLGGENLINKAKSIYWGYKYWMKSDISIINSIIYNAFGESIIFHSNSLYKQDYSMGAYDNILKNITNTLFIIMVFCGFCLSMKTLLMKLLLCFLSIDVLIHLIFRFGISEIYIYSPHFLFVFIISIGFLVKNAHNGAKKISLTLISFFIGFLYYVNIMEITHYLW